MSIRTFAELATANEQTRRFTSLGFATGGMLSSEDAAEFQQQCIATADLVEAVPDSTRASFERLRTLHAYGVLCYDAFTVADDLSWVVLEQALRERFVTFYEGNVPLVAPDGTETVLALSDFADLGDALRARGSSLKGVKLRLRAGGTVALPRTLAPLLVWARREHLLEGQRNRRVEQDLFHQIRNRFAHGTDFHVTMPPDSARRIRDLAEIINRLWGVLTPCGRLYPAPMTREVLAVGWSPGWETGATGASLVVTRPDQLAQDAKDQDGWTYIVLRGVASDPEITSFDARYEVTAFPTDLLWGPGRRDAALAWLATVKPGSDSQPHLDRMFAIRCHAGKVFLPCRPEIMLSIPADRRAGAWHVVRADFPNDALAHVRHADVSECRTGRIGGCPVEDVHKGTWREVAKTVAALCPGIQPAQHSDVRVPRAMNRPDFGDE